MGMYKQPLLILFWETLTFWNPVAKFDIAPKNRCWTTAEYQYIVIYFISRKHQKKMRKSFFLAPARQVNPQTGLGWEPQATKKAGARQSSIWSLQAFLLNVNPVRFSRQSLRSHGSHRTLEKSQTNAISVTFCALVEVSWGNHWKAIAEKIKRIVIDAIFCPIVQASWGHIWKRKV